MSFMRRQITIKCSWYRVETTAGTFFVESDVIGKQEPADSLAFDSNVEGNVLSWELIQGYGARLSAPGYLDCTDRTVFDTPEEAEKYLEDMYGDDEDESEEA